VAFAQFAPDWTRIAIVAGIVLVGQFLEGNVLASQTGCNPILLPSFGYFRAIRIRVSFRGFVGLLLAVPLAAGSGVLIRFALARYFASPLGRHNIIGTIAECLRRHRVRARLCLVPVSLRSRSIILKALRARTFFPGPAMPRRWR
ncbi:MAG TPA: hypothetical protein VIH63_02315, partial [Xanthobacteraceae bacterium]